MKENKIKRSWETKNKNNDGKQSDGKQDEGEQNEARQHGGGNFPFCLVSCQDWFSTQAGIRSTCFGLNGLDYTTHMWRSASFKLDRGQTNARDILHRRQASQTTQTEDDPLFGFQARMHPTFFLTFLLTFFSDISYILSGISSSMSS